MTRLIRSTAIAAFLAVGTSLSAEGLIDATRFFQDEGESLDPWSFVPESNVAALDRESIPGLLTLKLAGEESDVKGLLPQPIRLDGTPMPWYFQLGMMQDQNAVSGMVGSRTQVNYAFGLNVAVTFSDPATWPADRSVRPPDTHDVQLFVVHLGATGEVTEGLPQYTTDQHPEKYLVWGRGDLGYSVMGDWRIPYVEIGNGMRDGGPASSRVYFQCRVDNPTTISIGFKANSNHDYNMRQIDFSKLYGAATGIWEIGPIVSGDRWIPDELCRVLPFGRGPQPFLFGSRHVDDRHQSQWVSVPQPIPEPPHPNIRYHIDYMVFGSFAGANLESLSDDFDVPGYLDRGRFQLYASRVDTHTSPGYLTWTKSGRSIECLAWATPDPMRFKDFPPPWEIETCVIPPDDAWNWDFNIGLGLLNAEGRDMTYWYPGVRNLPVSGRREYFDSWRGNERRPRLEIKFNEEEDLNRALSGDRVYFLTQILDEGRVRVGFKALEEDPWTFSDVFDTATIVDEPLASLMFVAWNASSVVPPEGESLGFPDYQQYRFDYFRYRYGLSK